MSRGVVVWITGLPSSGKSTFAAHLREQLVTLGIASCLLDSDEVRGALVPAPGYDEVGRDHFYDTLGRLAAMLESQGLVVVVPATAHRRAYRDRARRRAERWLEVFLDVPAEECRARDAKGLYAASAAGTARAVPGADLGYEAPPTPDVVARGGHDLDAVARVIAEIAESRRRTSPR
ncbi:MAG TPA: adenylyl-sulfate kinase [Polyangiaceae bacterium]|nr:adenylyl-sulfate kinase [Polyangiaceae bacterium]